MEITQEHKTQIEEIISDIECQKEFKCFKSGFAELCKAQIFGSGEMVECLDEYPHRCNFSFGFGRSYLCKCSLRKYITKNFNM